MRQLMLQGDDARFCVAQGHRPAATWVEKDDAWLWRLLLPTTIKRTYCVGDDHYSPEKLGCPVHASISGTVRKVNERYVEIIA